MTSIRDLVVLASRRGFEYAIDSLRLSMICTPAVSQHL